MQKSPSRYKAPASIEHISCNVYRRIVQDYVELLYRLSTICTVNLEQMSELTLNYCICCTQLAMCVTEGPKRRKPPAFNERSSHRTLCEKDPKLQEGPAPNSGMFYCAHHGKVQNNSRLLQFVKILCMRPGEDCGMKVNYYELERQLPEKTVDYCEAGTEWSERTAKYIMQRSKVQHICKSVRNDS